MKVIINACYGGCGFSDTAYEWLIAHGIPTQKYVEEQRGNDGLYKPEPRNEGRVIFDRELTPEGESDYNDIYHKYKGKSRATQRYWDTWTRESRTDPLLVRLVEELGEAANGYYAKLRIVEIPDGTDYTIEEYDGSEWIAEKHRTWR